MSPRGAIALLITGVACAGTSPPTEDGDGRPAEGETRDAWGTEGLPGAECAPDGDGVLEAAELRVDPGLGVTAAFLVSPEGSSREVPADPWSLAHPAEPGDRVLRLGAQEMAGAWFSARFPGAHHHATFDASVGLHGVHALSDEGLGLLGLASEERDLTALVYSEPVPLIPTPLRDGDAWSVEVVAEGLADGVEYPVDWGLASVLTLHHRWTFRVDGVETLALPAADLTAHRLRVEVATEARNAAGWPVAEESRRVVLYVAECLGVVARVRSLQDEPDEEFRSASEILRLALPEAPP